MAIINRTPAGTICARPDSGRIFLIFRRRRVYTKLQNTRSGLAMAEELLSRLWRDEQGLGKPAQPRQISIADAWQKF